MTRELCTTSLKKCVTAHQNHTELHKCVVSGSGANVVGTALACGGRRELGSRRVTRVFVIVVSRAFIDTCQTIQGSCIFQVRLLLRFLRADCCCLSLDKYCAIFLGSVVGERPLGVSSCRGTCTTTTSDASAVLVTASGD